MVKLYPRLHTQNLDPLGEVERAAVPIVRQPAHQGAVDVALAVGDRRGALAQLEELFNVLRILDIPAGTGRGQEIFLAVQQPYKSLFPPHTP